MESGWPQTAFQAPKNDLSILFSMLLLILDSTEDSLKKPL